MAFLGFETVELVKKIENPLPSSSEKFFVEEDGEQLEIFKLKYDLEENGFYIEFRNSSHQIHRSKNRPARLWSEKGFEWIFFEYYCHGRIHRDDGPAVHGTMLGEKRIDQFRFQGKKIECSGLEEFLRIVKLQAFE